MQVSAYQALQGDEKWTGSILELMDAVDEYIPTPEREVDKPFLMPVEDVFTITGRGTVVTGRIERGIVKVNEEVEIVGIRPGAAQKTTVTGVEMFRKLLDEGQAGENVGLLLRGTKREDVERGMVVVKPGSTTPHTDFEAQVYILSKDEGGRHTPFFNNYRPQFYFRTTDVTGVVTLPGGHRDGHARRQHRHVGRADPADRHGGRPALRDPRGRPHRRRRPGHQDPQVAPPRVPAGSRRRGPRAAAPSPQTSSGTRKRRKKPMAGQKIRIRLKAYDHEVIDSSARKIVETVTKTGAQVKARCRCRPRRTCTASSARRTKYKDSREHFEMRTHKRLIDILEPTHKTIDSLMRLDLPAGVDIEIKL